MKVEIITLFPDFFISPLKVGRLNKALEQKNLKIKIHNLFDYGKGSYKQVDDRPYGGGPGMVLMIEPIWKVLKKIKAETGRKEEKIVLLSASGQLFNQKKAEEYSKLKRLILICGHFEGVDERVAQYLVDEEISIGNYVLSGGEPAALVVLDATVRLIEGVVGKEESLAEESFQITNNEKQTLVEYPQYTRPENFKGMTVPEILLSGNHQEIKKWRLKQALFKTKKNRPDLIK
jgi:tRNA (guanine37-N1)-methyltransferase